MTDRFGPESMTYYCKPFAHQTGEGWQPGIEYGWKGSEQSATRMVFEFTLDNEALALTFARSFADDEAAIAKRNIESAIASLRRDLGMDE